MLLNLTFAKTLGCAPVLGDSSDQSFFEFRDSLYRIVSCTAPAGINGAILRNVSPELQAAVFLEGRRQGDTGLVAQLREVGPQHEVLQA